MGSKAFRFAQTGSGLVLGFRRYPLNTGNFLSDKSAFIIHDGSLKQYLVVYAKSGLGWVRPHPIVLG